MNPPARAAFRRGQGGVAAPTHASRRLGGPGTATGLAFPRSRRAER